MPEEIIIKRIGWRDLEIFEAIPRLFRRAWNYGLGIQYPPVERLDPNYIADWVRSHGKEAYVVLYGGRVVASALMLVHDGKMEGCGWVVDPLYQNKGVGSRLVKKSFEEAESRFGRLKREGGANYVTSGSQRISKRHLGLRASALVPMMYNNLPEAYEKIGIDRRLAVSNGEVFMCDEIEEPVKVADRRMKGMLDALGVSCEYLDSRPANEVRVDFKDDAINGRRDLSIGGLSKLEDVLYEKPSYMKLLKVPLEALPIQKYLEALPDVFPLGILFDELIYGSFPEKKLEKLEFCEDSSCKGGCRVDDVARIHSPFLEIKNAYIEFCRHDVHDRR